MMAVVGGWVAFSAWGGGYCKPWGNRARKSKQTVTRSDLYLWSNFIGTLGVPYNAAYIGFVYTSLGLKGYHNGWW